MHQPIILLILRYVGWYIFLLPPAAVLSYLEII